MNTPLLAASGVFLVLALLAYKWEYEITRATVRRRRNEQWLLITGSLAVAVILFGVGL